VTAGCQFFLFSSLDSFSFSFISCFPENACITGRQRTDCQTISL
jgi:hypothetical protein